MAFLKRSQLERLVESTRRTPRRVACFVRRSCLNPPVMPSASCVRVICPKTNFCQFTIQCLARHMQVFYLWISSHLIKVVAWAQVQVLFIELNSVKFKILCSGDLDAIANNCIQPLPSNARVIDRRFKLKLRAFSPFPHSIFCASIRSFCHGFYCNLIIFLAPYFYLYSISIIL